MPTRPDCSATMIVFEVPSVQSAMRVCSFATSIPFEDHHPP